MGMFSWIDVDGSQNITDEDEKVTMLIPNEHKEAVAKIFGVEITGNGIEGKYNGYGSVIDKNGTETDVYDVTTFINLCLTSDEQFTEALSQISNHFSDYTQDIAKDIRQAYKDGKLKTKADLYPMVDGVLADDFRTIGIEMACYDKQNARIPYPIKWTVDDRNTYENSEFSMSDPNQGFYKVKVADKHLYEYNELDFDCGLDETIEEEVYNEETGEYETVEVENPDWIDPYDNYCDSDEKSKYDACEEYEELDEKRDNILSEVRAEREKAGKEVEPAKPKKEIEYAKPDYTLVGVNGNAFAIMGYTARALKNEGLHDKVDEMNAKATDGDYSHLIAVCDEYITMANEAKNAPKTFGKSDVDMPTGSNKNKGQIQE